MNEVVTRCALNYGEALFSVCPDINKAEAAFEVLSVSELTDALSNPAVSLEEKYSVVDRLFDSSAAGTVKMICKNCDYQVFAALKPAYKTVWNYHNSVVEGLLEYVKEPKPEELDRLKKTLAKKYGVNSDELRLAEKKELIKGYRLKINDRIYDSSALSFLNRMYGALVRR